MGYKNQSHPLMGRKYLIMVFAVMCSVCLSPGRIFMAPSYAQTTPSQPVPPVMTLSDAVTYALQNNTDIKSQTAMIKVANAQYIQSRADWLLQVDLTSEMDYYNNTNATVSPGINGNIMYTNLEVSQPVVSFGKYKNAVAGSKVYFNNQQVLLTDVQRTVAYNVTAAFYNVLFQQELVNVNENAVKTAEEHLKNAELRMKQGVNTKFDVTRSQVDLFNRKSDLISAQTAFEKARQSFNQFLNLEPAAQIKLDGVLEYKEYQPTVALLMESALQYRSSLKSKQLTVQQYQYLVNYRKSSYYPTVSVGGKYTLEHTDYDTHAEKNFNQWSAYLKMTVPLFDGFKISGQVSEAKANLEQATIALQKEMLNTRVEVEQAVLDIQKQKDLVQSNRATIDLAELSLKMAKLSYENGKATTLDVSDAELSLRTARSNWAKAVNDYLVALAKLKKAIGTDELPG